MTDRADTIRAARVDGQHYRRARLQAGLVVLPDDVVADLLRDAAPKATVNVFDIMALVIACSALAFAAGHFLR